MIFGLTADAVQLSFKGIIVDAQPVDDLWAGLDKTCAMNGWLWRDFSPSTSGLTGTLRQPKSSCPFAVTSFSK